MKPALFAVTMAAALTGACAGHAQSVFDWLPGFGHGRTRAVSFDTGPDPAATRLSFAPAATAATAARARPRAEYFLSDSLAVEMIGDWPFALGSPKARAGRPDAAANLPPVVTLQYHFRVDDQTTTFLGAGLNNLPLGGDTPDGVSTFSSLDRGWGTALRAGVDFALSRNGALRTDLSWFDDDQTGRRLDMPFSAGDADPWALGISYVLKF